MLCYEEIYRQKLQQCVADGELSDEDVSALLKLRVMLCVPQQTVEAAHTDICGSLFEKVMIFWHLSLLLIMPSTLVSNNSFSLATKKKREHFHLLSSWLWPMGSL